MHEDCLMEVDVRRYNKRQLYEHAIDAMDATSI